VGGVGPFLPIAVTPGRMVPVLRFPPITPVLIHASHYVTMPSFALSAGITIPAGLQTFTVNYQTAHRILAASIPPTVFFVLYVETCLTRGGAPYTRAYIAPEPPIM